MSNTISRFKISVVAFKHRNYITSFLNSLFKKKQMTKTYKHPKVKVNLKVIQLLNKITILQNISFTLPEGRLSDWKAATEKGWNEILQPPKLKEYFKKHLVPSPPNTYLLLPRPLCLPRVCTPCSREQRRWQTLRRNWWRSSLCWSGEHPWRRITNTSFSL